MKLFHKLSPISNFGYGTTVKPRPLEDYIGMKISVLPHTQLELTVIEIRILQRILQVLAHF